MSQIKLSVIAVKSTLTAMYIYYINNKVNVIILHSIQKLTTHERSSHYQLIYSWSNKLSNGT